MARLCDAVAALDPVRVRFEAHAIKGSACTIGAELLASVCTRLEAAGKDGDLEYAPALLAKTAAHLPLLATALDSYLASFTE